MTQGDLQYIADSFLIDKLFLIDATINKKAGMADGLLGSIAGSIMDWGKEHIDTSDGASSIISSLADLLVPGVLFKINPMLGGLAAVADSLGFSPISVVKKIIQFVQQKLESGALPTLEEVNSIGKSAVSGEAGPMLVEAANMLDLLHQIEKKGKLVRLVRTAQYRGGQSLPEIPFFGGKGGVIEKIFGQLFQLRAKNKAKWLLGGFVVWIVKTILLGAGLIAGAEKVVSLLGGEKNNQSTSNDIMTVNNPNTTFVQENPVETSVVSGKNLTPTGRGQDIHTNDHKTSTWVVPMIGGSIESTLLAWAGDVYKELVGYESAIASTESFNKTVEQMRRGLDGSKSNQLTVPSQFKSRKQIVDQFASEAAYKIQG